LQCRSSLSHAVNHARCRALNCGAMWDCRSAGRTLSSPLDRTPSSHTTASLERTTDLRAFRQSQRNSHDAPSTATSGSTYIAHLRRTKSIGDRRSEVSTALARSREQHAAHVGQTRGHGRSRDVEYILPPEASGEGVLHFTRVRCRRVTVFDRTGMAGAGTARDGNAATGEDASIKVEDVILAGKYRMPKFQRTV
jgi:hypothetical protein